MAASCAYEWGLVTEKSGWYSALGVRALYHPLFAGQKFHRRTPEAATREGFSFDQKISTVHVVRRCKFFVQARRLQFLNDMQ